MEESAACFSVQRCIASAFHLKLEMFKTIAKKFPPIQRLIAERDMLRDVLAAQFDSIYDSEQTTANRSHREAVGGAWSKIGRLQFRFLVDSGLKPENSFLDVGCGSLRGGLHFIPYLDSGNYWGVDINESLLEAGWNKELGDLQARQPREQLVCLKDFEFSTLNQQFDFIIVISVFTHLNLNRIRRCLSRLAPVLLPDGKVFATFFEAPEDMQDSHRQGGFVSYPHRDPFHYRFEDFEHAVSELPFTIENHGDWGHPRGQKMLIFSIV